eukprot:350885-Chlamydomonas_euryale.AAC.2
MQPFYIHAPGYKSNCFLQARCGPTTCSQSARHHWRREWLHGPESVDLDGYKFGCVVQGTVEFVDETFCAIVRLDDGNVGMLHQSEVSDDCFHDITKFLAVGDRIKAMYVDHNEVDGRCSRLLLSTKALEVAPGDLLRCPQLVYEKAEETAKSYCQSVDAAAVRRKLRRFLRRKK